MSSRLEKWFREQSGLVTREQAMSCGISKSALQHRLAIGAWVVAAPGVYRLPSVPVTWWQRAAAVCLQGAPRIALCRGSAAHFYRLEGFERTPDVIEVTMPWDRPIRAGDGVRLYRARRVHPQYFRYRDGVSVTSPQRTLVDLAGVVNETRLDVLLTGAMRKGLVKPEVLHALVTQLNPRVYRGLSVLRQLVKDLVMTDSGFETEVLHLCWLAGLPTPLVRFNVCSGDRWICEVDLAWPDLKLCVPAQSLFHHSKAKRFYRDNEQSGELVAAGWHPIPATKRDVLARPLDFVARLQKARDLATTRREHEPPGEGEISTW
ncbi:MAG: type IV toxin-antitoxin system AbiEi family antitoxin domain-containing protein [Archangiaceae bacterium]|nr:type IV toxin-antitoxin system AbiEi family antitoxin domain-containing protein [Archangiaceae bacterium]